MISNFINKESLIKIGKINSPFSFKGYLKFSPFFNELEEFLKNSNIFIEYSNTKKQTLIELEDCKTQNQKLIIKFKNVSTEEDAKKLTNSILYIKRKDIKCNLIPQDILNFEVYDENKNKIGKVTDYGDYGQGIMICIKFEEDKQSLMYHFSDLHFPDNCIFEENKLILFNK